MNPVAETEAGPMCKTCKVEMVNMGAPPTGKNKGKSVYMCPKCHCSTSTPVLYKTPAKKFKRGAHVPGCPKCGTEFLQKPTPGVVIYCSVCDSYFAYDRWGRLVPCDELGTIYRVPPKRKRRKKELAK